jgi:hypothetical protein
MILVGMKGERLEHRDSVRMFWCCDLIVGVWATSQPNCLNCLVVISLVST